MGRPRQVIEGACYLATRRCAGRMFLLRPDELTNEAVVYCLGVAAERYGIVLHGVCVMSNTLCINYSDPRGDEARFRQHLLSLLSRCMNVIRGRWEAFFSSDEPSVIELVDAGAQLRMLVYNLTDPVRQQLVDRVERWPGVNSLAAQLAGRPMRASRPKAFFRANGDTPEEVTLHFAPLPAFAHLSDEEWRERLAAEVRAVEERAAEKRREQGTRVAGRKAVRRQSPFGCPSSVPPRRNPNPRVACDDDEQRAAVFERLKTFRTEYRAALARFRDAVARGLSTAAILFPYGTLQLARHLGLVATEPAPAPS